VNRERAGTGKGIYAIVSRWRKAVDVDGDYVQK